MAKTDIVFDKCRSQPERKAGIGGRTSQDGVYLLEMRKGPVKTTTLLLVFSLLASSCVIAKSVGDDDSRITMYRVWETEWTFMKGDIYITDNRLLLETGRVDVYYSAMKINGETVIIQFVVEENTRGTLP